MKIPVPIRQLPPARCAGYLLNEALVYIGVVFVILGVGYAALYHGIDSSVLLRRNADDVTRALHIGEVWRADIRSATKVQPQVEAGETLLQLQGPKKQVTYRFACNSVQRRVDSGPWVSLLEQVAASSMQLDPRPNVTAWRWELELQPKARGTVRPGHVRPLFTFLAVPQPGSTP